MIVKESLSEQIYHVLRSDLIEHKIEFGETLVNRSLQKRFNVSSTPVRDALLRLKEDGIIETITRSGAKIIDYDYAIQVNQLLMTITLGAIEYSLDMEAKPKILDNLRVYVKLQEENINTPTYYTYDYHFHKTFFDFSHNKLLKDIFKKYHLINEILVRAYHEDVLKQEKQNCLKEHQEIIKYIEKNDITTLLKIVKNHYLTAESIFKRILVIHNKK